ncbi:gp16 family protein [Mesorhizobium sp. J428]|uniref:gp16 family protein n=1 Tax=Mesorhizobium sp. J428 TaxID=2898440 RepID=UPI0021513E7E|nr:regulatory protein GemA [Mesorhizobium sp. J428]MCR5855971.1 regulatory protein GemA [Mesorhizobium sp. J428]
MNPTAAIHVAKKQLGLDDDTYRDLLQRVTGKRSAGDMSEAERQAVLDEMRRQGGGFKPGSNGSRKPLEGRFAKKLQALWIAGWNLGVVRDRDDAALIAFVRRQTHIDHVRFLVDAAEARKAVEAIKGWLTREAGVDWSDGSDKPAWLREPGAQIAMAQWSLLANAHVVERDFTAFHNFVQARAFRPLGQMKAGEWKGIMNTLGERVRKVRG